MNTLFIGRRLIHLQTVDSTNNFAASLSLAEAPEGTVVFADDQTSGRGQQGKIWESEPHKNLTVTVVLRPISLDIAELPLLSKAIAVAVCKTIQHFLPKEEIRLKWPNDLYCNKFKLAGVLTENNLRGSQIVSYLAGIGINANQLVFDQKAGNASSIAKIKGEEISITHLLDVLCENIEAMYLQVKSKQKVDAVYHKLLYKLGEMQEFRAKNEYFNAKILGVTDKGLLQIEKEDGSIGEYRNGEIQYLITNA
ncbi:MAG: biotin--[acetyl-CoA-carboxylase] ligase [Bacteroidia bacterium]